MRLRPGDIWVHHPACGDEGREYEVVRVSPESATCRSVSRTREEFTTRKGIEVGFDAPGPVFHISLAANVTVVRHVEPRAVVKKKGL